MHLIFFPSFRDDEDDEEDEESEEEETPVKVSTSFTVSLEPPEWTLTFSLTAACCSQPKAAPAKQATPAQNGKGAKGTTPAKKQVTISLLSIQMLVEVSL